MNTKRSLLLLACLALLSVVLVACGDSVDSELPAATEPPVATAPAATEFPTGSFVKQGTEAYVLEINEDGTYVVRNQGMVLARATYSVEGNVFTETSNNGGCDTNVAFNYTFDGANLTFTYVGNPEDDSACGGRKADFNNVTYILSEE